MRLGAGGGVSSASAFPNQPQLVLCKNFGARPTLTSPPCVVCVTHTARCSTAVVLRAVQGY